jgi:flavin-dependent thymidylate synthase
MKSYPLQTHDPRFPGYVKLVQAQGDDALIYERLRTSTNKHNTSYTPEEMKRTLTKAFIDGHHTPFEFGRLILEIKAPKFVFDQLIRKRLSSAVVRSMRYTAMEDAEFYVPTRGRRGVTNTEGTAFHQGQYNKLALDEYHRRISLGQPKEIARGCLPLDIFVTWSWVMDIWNYSELLLSRQSKAAQLETQWYANAMEGPFEDSFPIIHAAWTQKQERRATVRKHAKAYKRQGWS